MTMKKTLIALLMFLPLGALAAPTVSFTPSLVPISNNTYYLGTTSPSTLQWLGIFTKALQVSDLGGSGTRCLQTDTNGLIAKAAAGCGSGSGGSGGGTWATTTSQTSSYINYPLNSTDIVVIGDSATTTGPIYFDPNLSLVKLFNQYFSTSSTTLQKLTFTTATGSSATTTSFFSTNASTTNLFGTNISGFGLTSCTGTSALTYSGTVFGCTAQPQGTVTSVTGTSNRITSTGGATPIIDISGSYVGQSSITTLGTITTGVWNGTSIANANLANSTISGIALGGTLNNHSHDSTLNGTSYNGSATVSDWGLNLGTGNIWTTASTTFVNGVTFGTSTTTSATTTSFFATTASTTNLFLSTGVGCLEATVTGKVITSTGLACGSGGGGSSNSKWGTSTTPTTGITPNGGIATNVGIGTSTPVSLLTIGTTTSYTASIPNVLIGPRTLVSGSANGTLIGANTDLFSGNFIDLQKAGTSEFSVSNVGAITVPVGGSLNLGAGNNITTSGATVLMSGSNLQIAGSFSFSDATKPLFWSGRASITSPADGIVDIQNNAGTDFTRLDFGGTTTAFPALTKFTGTGGPGLAVTLADGTAGGVFGVGTTTPQWVAEFASSTKPQLTLTDPTNTANPHLSERYAGGLLYLATSSPSTFATSTTNSLVLDTTQSGSLSLGSSTPTFSAVNGMITLGSNGASGSSTISMGKLQFDGYSNTGTRQCAFFVGSALTVVSGACTP